MFLNLLFLLFKQILNIVILIVKWIVVTSLIMHLFWILEIKHILIKINRQIMFINIIKQLRNHHIIVFLVFIFICFLNILRSCINLYFLLMNYIINLYTFQSIVLIKWTHIKGFQVFLWPFLINIRSENILCADF